MVALVKPPRCCFEGQFSCISTVVNCQEDCAADSLEEQLLVVKKVKSKMWCLLHRGCGILAEGGTLCYSGGVKLLMGFPGPS